MINTTSGAQAIRDSYSIRRQTLLANIPYFTTMAAACAAAGAIEVERKRGARFSVRSLQEYHARAEARRPRLRTALLRLCAAARVRTRSAPWTAIR